MAGGNVVRFGATFDTKGVTDGLNRIQKGFRDLDANTAQLQRGFGKIGAGIGTGIKTGLAIGAVAVAGFATQVKAGLDSLIELERIGAQTAAVIKSTGGAAGVTAGDVRNLAEKFEGLNATIDDKVIQSAENLLLTFTSIRKDAFEPTLQAALDMNAAMGGGEEGLQTTIIQVGKALQDPIKGITALRRVGVNFSEDQQNVIKKLVETGDLLGAQKLILKELNTEFGGSFLAQGNTTAGKVAKFKDAIEDAQKALATGFLPVVSRLADVLQRRLADPAVLAQIESFGNKVAGLFSDENIAKGEAFAEKVWGKLGDIPWGTIGDGLRIAGDASKLAIDSFLKLPANVQGGLITLLAANKLTGGLVASGIGDIAGFVLKSLGGKIFATNVTVVGANVSGGGVPGATGGTSKLAALGIAGAIVGVATEVVGPAVRQWALDNGLAGSGSNAGKSESQLAWERNHPLPVDVQNFPQNSPAPDRIDPVTKTLDGVAESLSSINDAANAARDDVHAQLAGTLDAQKAIEDGNALVKVYGTGTALAQRGAAKANEWVGRNIEILKGLQQKFAQSGDVKTAAALGSDINQLKLFLGGKLDVLPTALSLALASLTPHQAAVITSLTGGTGPTTTSGGGTTGTLVGGQIVYHQAGYVGSFDRPTHAVFGEAGREEVAILRNPRRMMLPAPAQPYVNNVYVSIDSRHVTKRQRAGSVWNTLATR